MRAHVSGSAVANRDEDSADGVPKRTPIVLLGAFFTIFWAIFTPPVHTFPARVLLLQPTWFWRIWTSDGTWTQDLLLFLILHAAYALRSGTWSLPKLGSIATLDWQHGVLQIYLQVFSLLTCCGLLAGLIVYRGRQLNEVAKEGSHFDTRIDEALLPALLLPGHTTHSRSFPKKHSFSYSYLLVGVPVGLTGSVGSALSVDTGRRGWFHVDSSDYLARSKGRSRLADKLRAYLHTQGVTDRDYAFAYLVTAPKFAGYSFNPVSFWYLYDSDTSLKFMVLEVNNTFGERRMYLLRPEQAQSQIVDSGVDEAGDEADDEAKVNPKAVVFRETWEKDFHVSPFNSRKGSYSLRAIDPLAAYQETGLVKIDNTIVLRSSKDHPKIVARITNDGNPVAPNKITRVQLARFIAGWWWVGFFTFPRIIWEASKLFFKKKLHVWYRPEVTGRTTARSYNDDEEILEDFFRLFLTSAVQGTQTALKVVYQPAHGQEVTLYSPGNTYEEDHKQALHIRVLTPAFYSRFIHYAHAREAFDRECLFTDDKNRTMVAEPAELIPVLLNAMGRGAKGDDAFSEQSALNKARWQIMESLRCPPAVQSYADGLAKAIPQDLYSITDIRNFSASELDRFVLQNCDDAGLYRRTVTKLFLAERIGLGIPIVVSMLDRILRAGMILTAILWIDHAEAFDILRPRQHTAEDIVSGVTILTLANVVHLWSIAKT